MTYVLLMKVARPRAEVDDRQVEHIHAGAADDAARRQFPVAEEPAVLALAPVEDEEHGDARDEADAAHEPHVHRLDVAESADQQHVHREARRRRNHQQDAATVMREDEAGCRVGHGEGEPAMLRRTLPGATEKAPPTRAGARRLSVGAAGPKAEVTWPRHFALAKAALRLAS
jgi:hypothetical protein